MRAAAAPAPRPRGGDSLRRAHRRRGAAGGATLSSFRHGVSSMSYSLPQLHLVLDPRHGELVRTFVRETSMSEGASAEFATAAARVVERAWEQLCDAVTSTERADIRTRLTSSGIETCARLRGMSRFPGLVPLLDGLSGDAIDVSWREWGIDGWELTVLRHNEKAQEAHLLAMGAAPADAAPSAASRP